jgi:hypothetical protein
MGCMRGTLEMTVRKPEVTRFEVLITGIEAPDTGASILKKIAFKL